MNQGTPAIGPAAFVGRETELGELEAALDDAWASRGSVRLLVGESGIGKTRLAGELATRASARGARVLWGRCWEGEGAPAYWPWTQVLRTYAMGLEDPAAEMGPSAQYIAQVVPELGAPPTSRTAFTADARFSLFDAVADVLRLAASERPLVVLLDDLHVADAPSLAMLAYVGPALVDARVLFVATYRDDVPTGGERSADLARVARLGPQIRLPGLGPDQIVDLVVSGFGVHPSDGVVDAVLRATDGNPFLVDEVVRQLVATGRIHESDPDRVSIPGSIRSIVASRFDSVGDEVRRILAAASVIGRRFTLAELEQVTGRPRPELLEELDTAIAAGLLSPAPVALGRYAFAHAMIRETLYGELAAGERARLHAAVADAVRLRPGDESGHLAEVAYHLREATSIVGADRVLEALERAGRQALADLAFEQAAEWFREAIDALDLMVPGDPLRRCELLMSWGEALLVSGRVVDGRARYRQAAYVARREGSADLFARAVLGYAAWWTEAGTSDPQLVGLLGHALDALEPGQEALRARVLARLAEELHWSEPPERREAMCREAIEMGRASGEPDTLVYVLGAAHFALAGMWGPDEGLAACDEMEQVAQRSGDRELSQAVKAWRITYRLETGQIRGVDADIEAYTRVAERLRRPSQLWGAAVLRAMRAMVDGRFEDAERLVGEALAVAQQTDAPNAMKVWGGQLDTLYRELGRFDVLIAGLEAIVRDEPDVPIFRCSLASSYAEAGRADEARKLLAELATDGFAALPRDLTRVACLSYVADACVAVGAQSYAEKLAELLSPFAGRNVVVGYHVACRGPVDLRLGRLAWLSGSNDAAERFLRSALAMAQGMASAPFEARARLALGLVLRARDDTNEADEMLRTAHRLATDLGMPSLAEEAAGALSTRPAEMDAASAGGPVFRRDGDQWVVGLSEDTVRLRDAKGLRYLHALLGRACQPVPASELALAAGGSSRSSTDPERARVNVTRAIRSAIDRIKGVDTATGQHLEQAVRTGTACEYVPSGRPPRWRLDAGTDDHGL